MTWQGAMPEAGWAVMAVLCFAPTAIGPEEIATAASRALKSTPHRTTDYAKSRAAAWASKP